MYKMQIDVVYNKLPKLPAALRREAERAVERNARECGAVAKSLAPVDTGKLRDSIDARPDGSMAWVVGPHTDYAAYVEYGTSRMAAQPYLTPATERQRSRFIGDMEQIVERVANG